MQDIALTYGKSVSRYTEGKRSVKDTPIGPLIATDLTRCIQCTRCVRFGQEIAGMPELGLIGRGEKLAIGTYVEKAVCSELSGNMIDVCPVGALTSKPYRYAGRSWEYDQKSFIGLHDGVGSHVYVHTFAQPGVDDTPRVMRVVPRENAAINEVWISDRDRFSYEGLYAKTRLTHPLCKINGRWEQVSWSVALAQAADALNQVRTREGVDKIGGMIHPSASMESCFLFQQCLRGMGVTHLDHRIREKDTSDQEDAPDYLGLGLSFSQLQAQQAFLVVGMHLRYAHPLLAHRIRQAGKAGARIHCVHPIDCTATFSMATMHCVPASDFVRVLSEILKALLLHSRGAHVASGNVPEVPDLPVSTSDDIEPTLLAALSEVMPSASAVETAMAMMETPNSVLLLGEMVFSHPDAALLRQLSHWIAQISGTHCGYVLPGANASGAWLAGAVPHRGPGGKALLPSESGCSAAQMWTSPLSAYVLQEMEPEYDTVNPAQALHALSMAKAVVMLTAYCSPKMKQYATVLLPIAPFVEQGGTWMNMAGQAQTVRAITPPLGEARPAWKVWRVLAARLGVKDMAYDTLSAVTHACLHHVSREWVTHWRRTLPLCTETLQKARQWEGGITRVGHWPPYRVDAVVRHATALQKTGLDMDVCANPDGDTAAHSDRQVCATISPALAERLGVKSGDTLRLVQVSGQKGVTLPCHIDHAVADRVVRVPMGVWETVDLGDALSSIEVQKVG